MKTLSLVMMAGLVVLSGCSDTKTTSTAGTADRALTNSDMEQAVKARFAADPRLMNEVISVSANADKKEITLTGTVPTQETRSAAVATAKASSPSAIVIDKIDVKPRQVSRAEYTESMAREARDKAKAVGEDIGDSIDDAWIHTKITSKLVTDSDTPARKINVDVKNNVVTLRGDVPTATAKAEAERIAKDTDGVKRVVNQLRVRANS